MTAELSDIVVVGASAGGVEALRGFVAGLPPDLEAAVLVVLHQPAAGRSALTAILGRSGLLPASVPEHGQPIVNGHIYVAPPGRHLLVVDGTMELSHGPTENGCRPAINALFRSAAVAAGPRVTGVLLSGVLDDGVAGMASIASRGGRVMVQDLDEALFPAMPNHVLNALPVEHVLPVADMGRVLAKLSRERVNVDPAASSPTLMRLENDITRADAANQRKADLDRLARTGRLSTLTCPDCSGPLIEIEQAARYRCRVGHAWTAEALLDAQGDAWERAVWMAIRTLDEKTELSTRMADRLSGTLPARYRATAEEAASAAALLRGSLTRRRPGAADPPS